MQSFLEDENGKVGHTAVKYKKGLSVTAYFKGK